MGASWGDPGRSRVGFGRARGGPEGTGTVLGGFKGGLGTDFCAPMRMRIRKIHIFVRLFDDFENRRFSQIELRGRSTLSLGGVGSAPCGPIGPPGECANFLFELQGSPLEWPKCAQVMIFEVNPALEYKILFLSFSGFGSVLGGFRIDGQRPKRSKGPLLKS